MVVKVTSFKLDTEIMKKLKITATEKEITQTELITQYLKEGLKKDGVDI